MACASVLIVDDDEIVRSVCRLALVEKYEIYEAEDGEAGWKLALAKRPDLVLTDMVMPKMDGLTLAERIKAHPALKQTLVLMMTGATEGEELPNGFWRMGTAADEFLQKPLDVTVLRATVHGMFEKRIRPQPTPRGGFM
mgnify:CR=1 FL=1